MAFTLQIKQKKLFGKTKLDIPTLAHACGFKYGSDDDFFILQESQENNKTAIFYNPDRIGRGIFFDGTKGENGFYEISYNIPTTRGEIIDFTRLVQEVERCLGKVEMYCVEEERTFTSGELKENIDKFVDFSLESLNQFCNNKEYQNYILTLALWPYTLPMDKVSAWRDCTDPADFEQTDADQRRWFAKEAFAVSSGYDSAIFNYFDRQGQVPSALRVAVDGIKPMRYGENPHQPGFFFGDFSAMFDQLHGKEISYNNLLDIDAAVSLIADFTETTFAVLKHNNACGVASRKTVAEAWRDALAGDPVSAFGGVLVTNAKVDVEAANEINTIFFEVIIAPEYSPEALEVLKTKKNRIILVQKKPLQTKSSYRSCLNGALVQARDLKVETAEDLNPVTKEPVDPAQIEDLLFANKIVKHSKSNAIVLAKNKQLLASGVGQTSRVDALKQAIAKAGSFDFSLKGAVMASDAFFPFADCVQIAHEAGINAVIQPGGSIRDQETIDYCNANGIAMAMTGIRHFKH